MTEDDAVDYWKAISSSLDKKNATWIIEQIKEKISLGKIESKQVDTSEGLSEVLIDPISKSPARKSRKQMVSFVSTVPYTEVEKLKILLDAIEISLVTPIKMEQEIPKKLESEMPISFISEDGEEGASHDVKVSDSYSIDKIERKLEESIKKIEVML